MPRGGWRGGGRPSPYTNQPTRTIRVPVVLSDEVLEFAKALDKGEAPAITGDRSGVDDACEILEQALTLKSNAGGAIKQKIREALALISK